MSIMGPESSFFLRRAVAAMLLSLAILPAASFAGSDVEDWITQFTGSPIYPSQYGLPGHPGAGVQAEAGKPVYKSWGYCERIAYPGSVEHVRVDEQRYIPVVPQYNAKTLLRNFRAVELPGLGAGRIVDFAEPIYYVPKYPFFHDGGKITDAFDTGMKNAPVKVITWGPGDPPIELDLGPLGPSVYAVRVIAATPTENVEMATRRLVIHFEVNDGPGGAVNSYFKRCASIDEFYSVVEFFFHAPEQRNYKAKLWVDASSRLPLLVYNFDLHDTTAQLAKLGAKKSPSLYDPVARRQVWESKGIPVVKKPLSPQERLDRDQKIWEQMPKDNVQVSNLFDNGIVWEPLIRTAPLPKDRVDDGTGIDSYGSDTLRDFKPPADWETTLKGEAAYQTILKVTAAKAITRHGLSRQTAYPLATKYAKAQREQFINGLALATQYHLTGDPQAGRDAVIYLASMAWRLPADNGRQCMYMIDVIPTIDGGHGDEAFRRRAKPMYYNMRGVWDSEPTSFVEAYDYLFPLIKDNKEVADSLSRFIPWVKTPDDVVKFMDTYLLQYYAHQIMTYGAFLSDPTPSWMAKVSAIQQDPAITKPWIDWLYQYVWTYPNKPMGVDELAVNNIQRDGTHKVGSRSYTGGGNFLTDLASVLAAYKNFGGTLPVDLTDATRYPKATMMTYIPLISRVAGGHYFQIGDVGGPNEARLSRLGPSDSALFRLGWQRTHDPRFATLLAHYFTRELETDEEWAAIQKAAEGRRSPFLSEGSRVLSDWFGLLETGSESDDFRFHRAVGLRVGTGFGHAHSDALDMQIWSQGVGLCGDGAQRPSYSSPPSESLISHNLVVSNVVAAGNHNWVSSLADAQGSRYLEARVASGGLYNRQVALIDANPGKPSAKPLPFDGPDVVLPKDVTPPDSYIVDVFRVRGGEAPYYAFHGPPADQLETNAASRMPGADSAEPMLARFKAPEKKWIGKVPDDSFTATWRMRRDPETIAWDNKPLIFPGAERVMLDKNFDPDAPRKFISMHVLGHPGATALGARTVCDQGSVHSFENVYVQPADWKGQTLFPVVFEPYSGQPYIQSLKLLFPSRITDANSPVAIEIKLGNGRTDIVYMAPRDSKPTDIPGVGTIQGEYALISSDDKGIRQLTLAGGTKLITKDASIESPIAAYQGKISSVDFASHSLVLDKPLPPSAVGQFVEVGPPTRRTAYTLAKVDGAAVQLDKGLDLAESRVVAVNDDGLVLTKSNIAFLGQAVSNQDGTKVWRVSERPAPTTQASAVAASPATDSPQTAPADTQSDQTQPAASSAASSQPDETERRQDEIFKSGHVIKLTGGPDVKSSVAVGDTLWVWEVGPGDGYRLPVGVNVVRAEDGSYGVASNAPVSVHVGGKDWTR